MMEGSLRIGYVFRVERIITVFQTRVIYIGIQESPKLKEHAITIKEQCAI